jgi:hypothetical protein
MDGYLSVKIYFDKIIGASAPRFIVVPDYVAPDGAQIDLVREFYKYASPTGLKQACFSAT